MNDKYQVTTWGDPDEMIATQYGKICYKHWIQLECDRWREKDFRNAWIEATPDGRTVAMFTDSREMRELTQEN